MPRETGNNAYGKFWGTDRLLWYFPKWPIQLFPFFPDNIQPFHRGFFDLNSSISLGMIAWPETIFFNRL